MPFSLLALSVVVSTMFTGCKTATQADIEQTSFPSQKSIFSEAQMISRKKSCEAGVNYLAELALDGSKESADFLYPVTTPSGFKEDLKLIKPTLDSGWKPALKVPIKKVIGESGLRTNHSLALDQFRRYLYYNGNEVSRFQHRQVWPEGDIHYEFCSKIEGYEKIDGRSFCRKYAAEHKFQFSKYQARKLWGELKSHPEFQCRRRRSLKRVSSY